VDSLHLPRKNALCHDQGPHPRAGTTAAPITGPATPTPPPARSPRFRPFRNAATYGPFSGGHEMRNVAARKLEIPEGTTCPYEILTGVIAQWKLRTARNSLSPSRGGGRLGRSVDEARTRICAWLGGLGRACRWNLGLPHGTGNPLQVSTKNAASMRRIERNNQPTPKYGPAPT